MGETCVSFVCLLRGHWTALLRYNSSPLAVDKSSNFSAFSSTLGTIHPFRDSHSGRCEVLADCASDLHTLMTDAAEHLVTWRVISLSLKKYLPHLSQSWEAGIKLPQPLLEMHLFCRRRRLLLLSSFLKVTLLGTDLHVGHLSLSAPTGTVPSPFGLSVRQSAACLQSAFIGCFE